MSGSFSLIVTDTSPLLTLVLADALDVLLRPGLPLSIPDAVYQRRAGEDPEAGARLREQLEWRRGGGPA